jgi:hypothetical protein
MVAYLIKIFKNMFLSLESDCFDEKSFSKILRKLEVVWGTF